MVICADSADECDVRPSTRLAETPEEAAEAWNGRYETNSRYYLKLDDFLNENILDRLNEAMDKLKSKAGATLPGHVQSQWRKTALYTYTCDNCGYKIRTDIVKNYCPNCGAEMKSS